MKELGLAISLEAILHYFGADYTLRLVRLIERDREEGRW